MNAYPTVKEEFLTVELNVNQNGRQEKRNADIFSVRCNLYSSCGSVLNHTNLVASLSCSANVNCKKASSITREY